MSRIATFAVAAALSLMAVPAFAQTNDGNRAEHRAQMEKKFPMPAAEFRANVERREEKVRAKVEEHIQKKNLAADKADAIRARVNLAQAKVNEKVDEVCADGTVTLDEAKAVRQVAKEFAPKHQKREHKPA